MTDLALPDAAPMRDYIEDTVASLAEMLEDTPADVLAGFDFSAQGRWAFARPGFPPLKVDQSLNEAGVVDGSLLTLVPVSRTERYRPLVEDVIDAIAVLDESPQFNRPALNRFIAVTIPLVVVVLTTLATLGWWDTGRSWRWMVAMGVLGVLVLVGSWVTAKIYKDVNLAESLLIAAVPLITVAVTLSIPPPRQAVWFGPPQLAAAAATVFFLTVLTRGGPRKRIELATFLAVTTVAATCAAIAIGYGWQRWVPAGAIMFGLITVTGAAKLTIAFARFALPPIPAPGETVEHDELLDPVMGRAEADNETPTWRAVIASVPNSAARLTERSRLAKQLLVGFVTAGALVLTIGAVAVVVRGHFFVHSLVAAALVTAVCGFRARLFAERWCAWALLAAAVAVPLAVVARLNHWYPHVGWLMLSGYLAAAVIALAAVASTAGVRRVTPVNRRILELVDGAVIAAIVPMLLWITSVYDIVRNIRF
jgi:type VII secretion integral membrane protein EccD